LSTHTRDITPSADFVNSALDHSVASLRATRRRQLLIGLGAAVAVGALVAWQAPSIDRRGSTPPVTHSDEPPIVDAYAWAQSLPRGADADVAYVDGHSLVVGRDRVDLGRVGGQLIAPLAGGWLATVGRIGPGPYGYLRPEGTFVEFEYQPRSGSVSGAAVSPDGCWAAYGRAVVYAGVGRTDCEFSARAPGQQVDTLPSSAQDIVEWTDAGLVFIDAHERYWLWAPGSEPQRQPFERVVAGGFGYTRDGDCVYVGPVSADVNPAKYQLCGMGDPLTVSASRRALMSDGEFTNLEAGVDFLTLPVGVLPEQLQLFWENDDSLILVVHDTAGVPHPPLLVRCVVSAGWCEQASDPLANYPLLASLPSPSR
jgi:hypothetical protein